MNLYLIKPNIVRFNIWNLLTPVSGHWTFYYNLETGKYVMRQHGDFNNLASIHEVDGELRTPTEEEKRALEPSINNRLMTAYHYDGEKCHSAWKPLMESNQNPNTCGGYYVFKFDERDYGDKEIILAQKAVELLTENEK